MLRLEEIRFFYYYYHYLLRVFHIIVSWWSFTGDCEKASLLKSPGLFSVFWSFSIMLLFGWSPLGRQLPNPPSPFIILQLPSQKHQSQLAQSSLLCSTAFFNSLARSRYLSFFFAFFQFYSVVSRDSKVDNFADSLFFVDYYKVWSPGRN